MTKKDFELIAAALAEARYLVDSEPPISAETARYRIAGEIADALATTNPRFDRDRFLDACGYNVS
jgi:hypothetical protein